MQDIETVKKALKKFEKAYRSHKESYKYMKWFFIFISIISLASFIQSREIIYLAFSVITWATVSLNGFVVHLERALLVSYEERIVFFETAKNKDKTIHNLIEMFFRLKMDISTNILSRDEIYDRIMNITGLINTGDITKDDCLKDVDK